MRLGLYGLASSSPPCTARGLGLKLGYRARAEALHCAHLDAQLRLRAHCAEPPERIEGAEEPLYHARLDRYIASRSELGLG